MSPRHFCFVIRMSDAKRPDPDVLDAAWGRLSVLVNTSKDYDECVALRRLARELYTRARVAHRENSTPALAHHVHNCKRFAQLTGEFLLELLDIADKEGAPYDDSIYCRD